jgi:hypothetical protein
MHFPMTLCSIASAMRMSSDPRDLCLYEDFLYYNPVLLMVSLFHHLLLSCRTVVTYKKRRKINCLAIVPMYLY